MQAASPDQGEGKKKKKIPKHITQGWPYFATGAALSQNKSVFTVQVDGNDNITVVQLGYTAHSVTYHQPED